MKMEIPNKCFVTCVVDEWEDVDGSLSTIYYNELNTCQIDGRIIQNM